VKILRVIQHGIQEQLCFYSTRIVRLYTYRLIWWTVTVIPLYQIYHLRPFIARLHQAVVMIMDNLDRKHWRSQPPFFVKVTIVSLVHSRLAL